MFIGREHELNSLNRLYSSNKFEFVVIYGRRHVGKTALVNQFIGDKKAIYYMGIESNVKQNLEYLSMCIIEHSIGIQSDSTFLSYDAALEYVFQLAEKERLILVIDEYPYMARTYKPLTSILQFLIDKNKESSKLMLILCGSSMSYMEDYVLANKAPFYGRTTAQMKVLPLEFKNIYFFFQHFSDEEKVLIYGVMGGTPQYLLQMNDKLSVAENIKNTFLNPTSSLFEEPGNLLKQEVREPALYNAIMTAIANGATRMSEISTRVGEDTNVCAAYLKNLLIHGFIQKEIPCGEKAARKSFYTINDNMFRFWYRFVPENYSVIVRGLADVAYKRIEPYLLDYMGKVFVEICKQYLWKLLLNGESPVKFKNLGCWWGTDSSVKKHIVIDIVGEQDGDTALFGVCNWTKEKVGSDILKLFLKRSQMLKYKKTQLYLFAKSGFAEGCVDMAKEMQNITLVTFNDVIQKIVE